MNRTDAQLALNAGKKITHIYFSEGEWVMKKVTYCATYVFEDGYEIAPYLFWADRAGEQWNEGWEIID